jgi:hypothetical protein
MFRSACSLRAVRPPDELLCPKMVHSFAFRLQKLRQWTCKMGGFPNPSRCRAALPSSSNQPPRDAVVQGHVRCAVSGAGSTSVTISGY